MKISIHAISVELLTNILDEPFLAARKGPGFCGRQKYDPALLLAARLAPDMFPLTRQVQIASRHEQNSAFPPCRSEPPNFEDNETTFEQLRARIARTIDFMKGLPAKAFEGTKDARSKCRPATARSSSKASNS